MNFKEYDDDTLKHLQKLELMILKDIDKICEENNLQYTMFGGSLLGAVRHQGFIPWDDDIDILMPQKDYEKLLEILKTDLDEKYEVVNYENTQDYFFLFTKIMLKGTKFEEWWADQVEFTPRINIDIFALINTSNNKYKRFYHLKMSHIYDRLFTMAVIKLKVHPNPTRFIANTIHSIIKLLRIPPEFFKNRALKLFDKYKDDDCIYASDPTSTKVSTYRKKDFFPSKRAKFEDTEVSIANNPDAILKLWFGDTYMELPPEDKRYNHAPDNIDFGKY